MLKRFVAVMRLYLDHVRRRPKHVKIDAMQYTKLQIAVRDSAHKMNFAIASSKVNDDLSIVLFAL